MPRLAIDGGEPVRTRPFPAYRIFNEEDAARVADVVRGGVLSRYLGCWDEDFLGGDEVRSFEESWRKTFGCRHAIAVNSNSTGLTTCLGALGIGPGDEVIVTSWSMSISAAAPLFYGALPVFADVEPDHYCIDPASVEAQQRDRHNGEWVPYANIEHETFQCRRCC